jgi:hypothetical protein
MDSRLREGRLHGRGGRGEEILCCPYRAKYVFADLFPGRCPGLSYAGLTGRDRDDVTECLSYPNKFIIFRDFDSKGRFLGVIILPDGAILLILLKFIIKMVI